MLRNKLASQNITLKSAFDALLKCNEDLYPNINFLFKILCTLPVSTACLERSFSSLKRIKSYLRNTISEKRQMV
ncbi:52 kDa repressor of the inhibitor of the protein kinase-like [Acyrthosiphon pisum]|uniref:HAT C-terminal dimerisation domain-containing protein n=1 Tax=Acyrthosiphon pisum TaxID=7029 RepID=A0A8R2JT12_ACYPI|nr:52 kDa repressor of the inhibitor of the protein kinase-like [Acyrthosiphon pisum]